VSVVSKTRISWRGCEEEIGGFSGTYCPLNPLQLPHILALNSCVGGDVKNEKEGKPEVWHGDLAEPGD